MFQGSGSRGEKRVSIEQRELLFVRVSFEECILGKCDFGGCWLEDVQKNMYCTPID